MRATSNNFNVPNVRSKGQGLVEFALVLLVFLAMVYAIFEIGRAVFVYQSVITASQEAARLGSSAEANDNGIPFYLDCDMIREQAIQLGAFGQVTAADVVISYDSGPGTALKGNCEDLTEPDIQYGDRIIVQVTGYYDPAAPILLIDFPALEFTTSASRTIIKNVPLNS